MIPTCENCETNIFVEVEPESARVINIDMFGEFARIEYDWMCGQCGEYVATSDNAFHQV